MEQFQINEKSNVVYIFSLIFFCHHNSGNKEKIPRASFSKNSKALKSHWIEVMFPAFTEANIKNHWFTRKTKLCIQSSIKTQTDLVLLLVLDRLELRTVQKMSAISEKHPTFDFFFKQVKMFKSTILKSKCPAVYNKSFFFSYSKQPLL